MHFLFVKWPRYFGLTIDCNLICFFLMRHAEVFITSSPIILSFSLLVPTTVFFFLQVAPFCCFYLNWPCANQCRAMKAELEKVAELIKFIAASNLLRFLVILFQCLFLLHSLTIFGPDSHSFRLGVQSVGILILNSKFFQRALRPRKINLLNKTRQSLKWSHARIHWIKQCPFHNWMTDKNPTVFCAKRSSLAPDYQRLGYMAIK